MSSNQKCSNDIYSELNFEKQRDQNLKRTQDLYQGIFSEYSQLYADYITTQQAVLANPNNMEVRNRSDASRTQKKPNIIKLIIALKSNIFYFILYLYNIIICLYYHYSR